MLINYYAFANIAHGTNRLLGLGYVDAIQPTYMVAQKWHNFLYALTLPNINRFSKLFHCQSQKKICNKVPTTPQLRCYTIL